MAIDQFAKAIDRFEAYTKYTDFEKFHVEQVRGFKQHLYEQTGVRSKAPLSQATIYSTLNTLKTLLHLARRSAGIQVAFQLRRLGIFQSVTGHAAIAKAHRTPRGPTLDQIRRALAAMPTERTYNAATARWSPWSRSPLPG